MHLRALVIFTLVLPRSARRSLRVDDSHRDAHQQRHTLADALEASAEARELFLPGVVGKGARPRAPRGQSGAWRPVGPRRAAVGPYAAGGPEDDERASEEVFFSLREDAAIATPLAARVLQVSRRGTAEMNLYQRFERLMKANINELLSNFEDPVKVVEQAVEDMKKDLVKVRQAYAEVSASTTRMDEQMKLAEAEAAKWYDRAQLAVAKGEDELARQALERRKLQLERCESFQEQVEGQQGALSSLYESMKDLEAKIAEAALKKDQIVARARTAQAVTEVNDMLAGLGTGSSVAAFDRMTEKVDQLEATAEASQQLAASSSTGAGSSLEGQFKALEAGSSVDDELLALKAGQGLLNASPADNKPSALKAATESPAGDVNASTDDDEPTALKTRD